MRAALLVAMLASFLTPFMASSINVALPTIASEFKLSAVLESWIPTSYLLAAAVFLVPFGRLSDIRGRKKVFANGIWVFVVGTVLCSIAPNGAFLIASRVVQGFGSAMMFGTSVAILTSVYPANQRGKALGLSTMVVYIGLSVGPFFGGLLTSFIGWRTIFLVTLPVAGALVIATRLLRGEWTGASGESFDVKGSAVYAVSLTAVIFGFSLLPDILGVIASLAGLAGIIVFIVLELRLKSPVLDITLFRHRAFAFSNFAALINYSATFAVGFLVALYLQNVKGLAADDAGIVLVAQPVVMAVFSPIAGRLSDRIEPQVIASIGMAISAVGLVFLALLDSSSSIPFIVFALAFLGLGFGLFSSPNTNAIMSSVERRCYGIASATVGTMRLIGQVLSLGVATMFIAIYVGGILITPAVSDDFLKSFQVSFVAFAIMCFAGVFASLARGKVRDEAICEIPEQRT